MTTPTALHQSQTNEYCQSIKDKIELKNINTVFSDAIKIARSLNGAIANFCPGCLNALEQAMSHEEQKASTMQRSKEQQSKAVVIGG